MNALNIISQENPTIGRDAVASACVMLGYDLPESQGGQSILPQLNKLKASFGNIYPNPTDESATFEYNLIGNSANLKITDITGRTINTFILNTEENIFSFSVKNYSEGIYFVNVEQSGKKLFTSKFIVIKK